MKTFAVASLVAAFLAGSTIAADPEGIPGYGLVEISWEVQTTSGGPTVVLNGTMEEVHAQLLEINPKYDQEFAHVQTKRGAVEEAAPKASRNALAKRDNTLCGNWPSASKSRIQQDINYLRNDVGGRPGNGPGPGNCGRVSCSNNAAIYWCNDNNFSYTLNGWWEIADGAQAIVNDCASAASYVSGQRFIWNGNWNVIVRGDSC
ncbi:hypothetical protein QBC35DRAFT_444941 [Podospora australis]|uniref:Secreted protein n=1 Tax=Podospora australis TaxID=1536484 RepID=A0AAN6WIV5_9PEZI|nr:hypothetical protein QBC35DRAFT_444941 [Podospora australis]